MEDKIKELKSSFLNLFFRGIIISFIGILNMLAIVIEVNSVYSGNNIYFFVIFNILIVCASAFLSLDYKKERNSIFLEIKKLEKK